MVVKNQKTFMKIDKLRVMSKKIAQEIERELFDGGATLPEFRALVSGIEQYAEDQDRGNNLPWYNQNGEPQWVQSTGKGFTALKRLNNINTEQLLVIPKHLMEEYKDTKAFRVVDTPSGILYKPIEQKQ